MKSCHNKVLVYLFLFGVIFLLLTPGTIHAVDAESEARIAKLEAAVESLQAELNALKAERSTGTGGQQFTVDQAYVDGLVSNAMEKNKSKMATIPDWIYTLKWSGDLRYRFESIDDDLASRDRKRNRIRARLGLKATLDDEWDVGFRLATGSSDSATSTNQTLDDTFEKKDFWLDRAYADYHPRTIDNLNITMGKIPNPFYLVGDNQLVWDSDLNPEGGAVKYNFEINDQMTAYINGGAFWVDERPAASDTSMMGLQGYVKKMFDNGNSMTGGVTYYNVGNVQGKTLAGSDGMLGNTSTAPLTYRYDYDMVEGFVDYGFKYNDLPMLVYANYIENVAAPDNTNGAYSLGIKVNKAKKPGDWEFGYQYHRIERDAVLSAINDGDLFGGMVGISGSKFSLKNQLTDKIQAGIVYFDDNMLKSDADYHKLRFEMLFKF
ncbi:MAG: putative porin [Sedimentisphaerales bacterium]|nr:putative porin [Sedimentisphaerales bacterium]